MTVIEYIIKNCHSNDLLEVLFPKIDKNLLLPFQQEIIDHSKKVKNCKNILHKKD